MELLVMNDAKIMTDSDEPSFRDEHRFSIMIVLAVFLALVLVTISMAIYYGSGAAQLDLSRPGYKSIRAQVENSDSDFQNYSATGQINQTTITEFKTLYNKQAQKIESVDAFSGDPLSPDSLGIGAVAE